MGRPERALGLPDQRRRGRPASSPTRSRTEMCVGVSGVTVRTYCVQSAAPVRKRRVVGRSCSVMAPCALLTSPSAALGDARVKKLNGAVGGRLLREAGRVGGEAAGPREGDDRRAAAQAVLVEDVDLVVAAVGRRPGVGDERLPAVALLDDQAVEPDAGRDEGRAGLRRGRHRGRVGAAAQQVLGLADEDVARARVGRDRGLRGEQAERVGRAGEERGGAVRACRRWRGRRARPRGPDGGRRDEAGARERRGGDVERVGRRSSRRPPGRSRRPTARSSGRAAAAPSSGSRTGTPLFGPPTTAVTRERWNMMRLPAKAVRLVPALPWGTACR